MFCCPIKALRVFCPVELESISAFAKIEASITITMVSGVSNGGEYKVVWKRSLAKICGLFESFFPGQGAGRFSNDLRNILFKRHS